MKTQAKVHTLCLRLLADLVESRLAPIKETAGIGSMRCGLKSQNDAGSAGRRTSPMIGVDSSLHYIEVEQSRMDQHLRCNSRSCGGPASLASRCALCRQICLATCTLYHNMRRIVKEKSACNELAAPARGFRRIHPACFPQTSAAVVQSSTELATASMTAARMGAGWTRLAAACSA